MARMTVKKRLRFIKYLSVFLEHILIETELLMKVVKHFLSRLFGKDFGALSSLAIYDFLLHGYPWHRSLQQPIYRFIL